MHNNNLLCLFFVLNISSRLDRGERSQQFLRQSILGLKQCAH